MNLPNKLTISRLIMAPLFFIVFFLPEWFGRELDLLSVVLLIILYALTELSDLLDGIIARKYHLVTDLGKVMDPFADTLSRLTYFVCFLGVQIMPVWAFAIIMWREFSIVFLRMLMMGTGKAVAANIWGKSKAVMYAISGIVGILYVSASRIMESSDWMVWAEPLLLVVFALAALASLASFATYLVSIFTNGALSHLSR
ncbi:CDP-diacylglycerol--glycerol-3-phosphate 3-phosphatidyltransferase [Pleomorphochaeta sp. DL1XJH-081]|jgi:CDP-diacylglycerol--glycerol-3-phosphate 3-phosphatidyltransferase|uniref:CDP-diacylglycerol--glycerol-3-phosphate 3-phosphatidyltransferase n=1 Tax=Pleomorphochaeta sp. DL1XJH-081 TaxID=3409690 RepID=UPI003BB634D7